MSRVQVGRAFAVAVCPALVASIIANVGIALAEDLGQVPPLDELLADAQTLIKQGDHADALRTIIRALEQYPDKAWDPEAYKDALEDALGCFLKMSDGDRQRLMDQYEGGSPEPGSSSVPPLRDLTNWLRELIPLTSLKSPGGRFCLGAMNFVQGNYARAIAYGMAVLQQAPDSRASEHVIIGLMAAQYYRLDPAGALRTVRVAANVAPNNRATGWAVCRGVLYLCAHNQAEQAKELCGKIQATAPGSVAADVAARMARLIDEIESMAFGSAFETMWGVRQYAIPGAAGEALDALAMGISWLRWRTDPACGERLDALMRAAKAEAASAADPQRRACALLIQAHCYQRRGLKKQSAELFQRVVDTRQPGLEEYALGQLGRDLARFDRKRAIAALERYRDRCESSAGSSPHVRRLARLYRLEGRYEEALKLFERLEDRCRRGQAIVDVRGDSLTAEKVGCLRGLGRDAEANVLAEPLLRRHRHGTPLDELNAKELGELYGLLKKMCRDEEAAVFEKEMLRRADQKLGHKR